MDRDTLILYYEDPKDAEARLDCLRKAVAVYTGAEPEGPADDWEVSREENGKPFFTHHRDICFNISHSGTYWVAAFSDMSIGVDIQYHGRHDEKSIAKRFFHESEIQYLLKHGDRSFYTIWSHKESYLKMTGRGITVPLSSFTVVDGGEIRRTIGRAEFRTIPFHTDYSLTVCGLHIGKVKLQQGE